MTMIKGETWGEQLRAYEREKRYEIDAGFVSGQQMRLQPGMFQAGDSDDGGLERDVRWRRAVALLSLMLVRSAFHNKQMNFMV